MASEALIWRAEVLMRCPECSGGCCPGGWEPGALLCEGTCSQNSPGCGEQAGKVQEPRRQVSGPSKAADPPGTPQLTWPGSIPPSAAVGSLSQALGAEVCAAQVLVIPQKGSWGPRGTLPSAADTPFQLLIRPELLPTPHCQEATDEGLLSLLVTAPSSAQEPEGLRRGLGGRGGP